MEGLVEAGKKDCQGGWIGRGREERIGRGKKEGWVGRGWEEGLVEDNGRKDW
jgi:hypothetical protein